MVSFVWKKSRSVKNLKPLMVIFIGDSITYGAKLFAPKYSAPPVVTFQVLQDAIKDKEVYFKNCGVNGATTIDYLPEKKYLYDKVKKAADKFVKNFSQSDQIIFSIMLGANDSAMAGPNGAMVNPEIYRQNLTEIINNLLLLYPNCRIILHYPIWFSNNTYVAAQYMKDAYDRLVSYLPELDSIVEGFSVSKPNSVFLGDTHGFTHFKNNYLLDHTHEKGDAGTFYLHPNKKGSTKLGELWGKAILKIINGCDS